MQREQWGWQQLLTVESIKLYRDFTGGLLALHINYQKSRSCRGNNRDGCGGMEELITQAIVGAIGLIGPTPIHSKA